MKRKTVYYTLLSLPVMLISAYALSVIPDRIYRIYYGNFSSQDQKVFCYELHAFSNEKLNRTPLVTIPKGAKWSDEYITLKADYAFFSSLVCEAPEHRYAFDVARTSYPNSIFVRSSIKICLRDDPHGSNFRMSLRESSDCDRF